MSFSVSRLEPRPTQHRERSDQMPHVLVVILDNDGLRVASGRFAGGTQLVNRG